MTREWKPRPGDVAVVKYRNDDGPEVIGIATTPHGNWRTQEHGSTFDVDAVRPLVLIDPDDRVQVERLRDLYDVEVIRQNDDPDPRDATPGASGNALQAALRSLIAPPRPEEPTGLGAVVEAINDNHFVRVATVDEGWVRVEDRSGAIYAYRDIEVVKVLSEGVQP